MSARTRAARFPHADDPAAAHVQSGVAHFAQRVEAVVLRARADHLAVELRRGVDVVVVVIETRGFQLRRLPGLQQSERGAGFHAEPAHRLHHFHHAIEITLLRASPRGAHAEARRAFLFRVACGRKHFVDRHERFVLDPGVVARRLRTVTAVFGAAAGLDGKQR